MKKVAIFSIKFTEDKDVDINFDFLLLRYDDFNENTSLIINFKIFKLCYLQRKMLYYYNWEFHFRVYKRLDRKINVRFL